MEIPKTVLYYHQPFLTRSGNYRSWSIFRLRFTYSVYISCCYLYFSKTSAIL